jgi:group I intron endonuclease
MNNGLIYIAVNKITGGKYVGKCFLPLHRRWHEHVRDANNGRGKRRRLYHALRKYGHRSFMLSKVAEIDGAAPDAKSSLAALEIIMIEHFRSFVGDSPRTGYNMTRGGEGGSYFGPRKKVVATAKTRKLISKNSARYWKGKHLSASTRRKISETRLARGYGIYHGWSKASIKRHKAALRGNKFRLGIPSTAAFIDHISTIHRERAEKARKPFKQWILRKLSLGPVYIFDLRRAATIDGLPWPKIWNASRRLPIVAIKRTFGWMWQLKGNE